MSPKTRHFVEIHPEYLAELRRRVETGPGLSAVAGAAGMDRVVLWRLIHEAGQRATFDGIERARAGLAYLEDGAPPIPPPVVSIRNATHYAWVQLADELMTESPELIEAALAQPDALRAALTAIARQSKRNST